MASRTVVSDTTRNRSSEPVKLLFADIAKALESGRLFWITSVGSAIVLLRGRQEKHRDSDEKTQHCWFMQVRATAWECRWPPGWIHPYSIQEDPALLIADCSPDSCCPSASCGLWDTLCGHVRAAGMTETPGSLTSGQQCPPKKHFPELGSPLLHFLYLLLAPRTMTTLLLPRGVGPAWPKVSRTRAHSPHCATEDRGGRPQGSESCGVASPSGSSFTQ